MNIAYLTAQYPCGNRESFLEAEVARLTELATAVVVIPTRPGKGAAPKHIHGAAVVRMPIFGLGTLLAASAELLLHPIRVLSVTSEILRTRYRTSTKVKNLAVLPKALAVAHLLRRRRIDHIHAHWLSTPSTVAYVASRLTGITWSCTAHRFDIFQDNLLISKARSARFIRAISQRNCDLLTARANGYLGARCKVVHLGVNIPATMRPSTKGEVLRVLCPAALVPVKGHTVLLAAMQMLRDRGVAVECDLAGEGPLRKQIASVIKQGRLGGRVRMRGHVAHDRLCGDLLTGRYDVVVLASTEEGTYFEGIPVALMEAMAAGVPCIATRTGSIAELVEDGAALMLVPQRDPAALAEAIEAFARDVAGRCYRGLRARERITTDFNAALTTRELFELMSAP